MLDEDLSHSEEISDFFKKKGFLFYAIHRLSDALDHIKDNEPCLILLNLHFSEGSGLQFCRSLKYHSTLHHIPIIAFSGRNFPIETDAAYAAGVSVLLDKPLRPDALEKAVNELLYGNIEISFWGVRGSIPCFGNQYSLYGGNTTCLQVSLPWQEKLLILDAGSGIRRLGEALMKEQTAVTGRLFITHPHLDHIQGFPFFNPLYSGGNQFDIHLPPQSAGNTREILMDNLSYTYFPVTSSMMNAKIRYHRQKASLHYYDGYGVRYMKANHPVETAIYALQAGRKKIVFCPDNELPLNAAENKNGEQFLSSFDTFISDADVLIHDAQYDIETHQNKVNWGHSAWETVLKRAMRSGVKNLFLTHHDPASTDEHLDKIAEKAQKMASASPGFSVYVAKEGERFLLPVMAS